MPPQNLEMLRQDPLFAKCVLASQVIEHYPETREIDPPCGCDRFEERNFCRTLKEQCNAFGMVQSVMADYSP